MKPQYICIDTDGDKCYYKDKKMSVLHREDGPAIECSDGYRYWYLNGMRHREDGPAVECSDGGRAWYRNDKLHREDGPAVEYPNGYKAWYLNGVALSEKEHSERTAKVVELTLEEIADLAGVDVSKLKIVKKKS